MFGRAARHILWFPFLLLALTIILAVTIVLVDDQGDDAVASLLPCEGEVSERSEDGGDCERTAPSITDEEYETAAASIMAVVWTNDDLAVDDWRTARDQLVATRVPSTMRDVHIQLVAAVNQRIAGLEGNVEAMADADIRFSALLAEQPWLQ